jgi:tetratricopeptide (TPR) repeat protein
MLAELLGVSVSVVRRWRRLGLIRPVQEVRKLAYYDFREVMSARRLAQLLAGGVSPARLKKQLDALRRVLPSIEGPLAQLTVIVEGKDILLRQGAGLIDAGGQMRFDFEAAPDDAHVSPIAARIGPPVAAQGGLSREHVSPAGTTSAHQLPAESATLAATDFATLAVQLEDAGRLAEAAEMYRAALAAAGPRSELCFALAELLYRLGDLAAARERYYMAIELDEDFVEARANLGCVLAEQGQLELAAAAFEGALRFHPDYADVHFHLARTLCKLGHPVQAAPHWSEFLRLAPHSPWSDEARQSLHGDHPPGLDSS